jgi:lysosomal alpha-mannosidase
LNGTINRKKRAQTIEMKGKSFSLTLDSQTGELISITNNGKTYPLHQTFKYYKSSAGVKNVEDSGTYNFCPNGSAVNMITNAKLVSTFNSGPLHEVAQQWTDWVSQTIRTYEDEEYVEFDWVVGPIPIGDNIGKEVIARFETNLNHEKVFYTDANGRQMVRRVRDPNAKLCTNNNISANWYPIYSKIFIRDDSQGKLK